MQKKPQNIFGIGAESKREPERQTEKRKKERNAGDHILSKL